MPGVTLPTFSASVPYEVQDAFARLRDHGAYIDSEVAGIPRHPPPLTLDQIRRALSVSGATPLNIFQLLGGSSASGGVLIGTHAQRITQSPATLPNGTPFYETDRTALYLVMTAQWWLMSNMAFGVTLSPDTKPSDLTARDSGFLIRSTDFDRQYRWSGTAWEDVKGQVQRGSIQWFPITIHADFTPGAGWQLCDGTAGVTRSTPTATTTTFTAQNLTGSNRFLRAVSGATGGTGGSATTHTHTVDPPNTTTGNESADQEVFTGVGTTVAQAPHTHDVNIASFASGAPSGSGGDDALPPYYNARPYIRV